MKSNITQTTAIGTVAKSLPQNKVILLNRLISNSYIPYTDLENKFSILCFKAMVSSMHKDVEETISAEMAAYI